MNTLENNAITHKRNTQGLAIARQHRQEECNKKVNKAIETLIKNKEKINFNSVAQLAGVSKKYLYDNHYDRIDLLRKKQEGLKPKQVKQNMTNNSKDILLAAKDKKIKELEKEIKRLKRILHQKYSDEYSEL